MELNVTIFFPAHPAAFVIWIGIMLIFLGFAGYKWAASAIVGG